MATRPSTPRVTSPPSAPIWPPALAVVRAASSESTTPIVTLASRTSVPPPVSPPTPEPESAAALISSEAPPVSTPEVTARAARTRVRAPGGQSLSRCVQLARCERRRRLLAGSRLARRSRKRSLNSNPNTSSSAAATSSSLVRAPLPPATATRGTRRPARGIRGSS